MSRSRPPRLGLFVAVYKLVAPHAEGVHQGLQRPDRLLGADVKGQARSHVFWLSVPYYVVTNGAETVVYASRGGSGQDFPLLTVQQAELAAKWDSLAALLSRHAVLAHKTRLATGWPTSAVGAQVDPGSMAGPTG